MSTTIFTAAPYDAEKVRRKRIRIIAACVVIMLLAGFGFAFRYWPYEHRVDKFFNALEAKDFEKAYGIWFNDPNWKQHPQNYSRYKFGEFYLDWGPGGEYGVIKEHSIDGSVSSGKWWGMGSGVIVQITVNKRSEPVRLWVEKSDKTLGFSPN